MKKGILLLVAVLCFTVAFSQGIKFEHIRFEEALVKAKKENKLVFMDCYTSWCGPCKQLSKKIFPQKAVGAIFNKNFVNIKMDMDTAEGKLLGEKYAVVGLPTLLWLDADGNVRHIVSGYCEADKLIVLAKIASDPNNKYALLNKRFVNGEHNDAFLQKYIAETAKLNLNTQEAADIYFSNKKNEDLLNSESTSVILNSIKSSQNPIFKYVLDNREKFYKFSTVWRVEGFINNLIIKDLGEVYIKGDKVKLAAKRKELAALDKEKEEMAMDYMRLIHRPNAKPSKKDRDKLHKNLIKHVLKYRTKDVSILSGFSSMIMSYKMDDELTSGVAKMLEKAIELHPVFQDVDRYVQVLKKMNREEEARVYAKKALELAITEKQKKKSWSAKFLK
jgi:thioredoxin-related protein